MGVLLALATLALYWPATQGDFVSYDDTDFVTENPYVQGGLNWEGVKWAFCNTKQAAYWAPFMWLSHMLAWHFFGSNPWGHHLINVLLHAASTALVFLVLRRMTRSTWRSLIVAALFGWHPLRVESVAWVTERKDVLSMLFGMLALWAYAKYVEAAPGWSARSKLWYGAALGMYVLGLMSKQVLLVTLPCFLLLLDYWPLRRMQNAECRLPNSAASDTQHATRTTFLPLLLEKIPFFTLAALASVMMIIAQKHGGTLGTNESLPLGARVGNALISYCRYLGKLFWPTDLAVFYPHPGHWPLGKELLAGGMLVGLSVLVWVPRRRHPYLLMGWLWFLGTLVPVIGLVQAGAQAMADRYTYLPSLGMLVLVVWGTSELTRAWRDRAMVLSVAGGAAMALCLALTWQQIGHWRDSEALFRHALGVAEHNALAHNGLGTALDRKGQIDQAIRQYQEAVRLSPGFPNAHNNLGIALIKKGQPDEAVHEFQEALRLKPDSADAHHNLGIALGQKGHTSEAILEFQKALKLKPDYADAHNYLGIALFKEGQVDAAISHYREAFRLKPDHANAHDNLGAALLMKGQVDEAVRQFQEASRLEPGDASMHNNLGAALEQKGRIEEAIGQYLQAIRLKPDYADAHNNLGHAFLKNGQIDLVIGEFQEAVRLKPGDAEAHYNLGIALFKKGQVDEAIRQYEEALRLKPDYASAHNNLGAAFMSKGQIDAAISQFQEALRLKPDQANTHNNLGIALGQNGRTGEAIREFQEALRLNPDYANARKNLQAALASQVDSARLSGTATNR